MNDLAALDSILNSLENSISYLIEAIRIISSGDDIKITNDTFRSIPDDITKLQYYNNQYLGEIGVSLKFVFSHLTSTFFDNNKAKEIIKKDSYEKILMCCNEVKNLRRKIANNSSYGKFFEQLTFIYRSLSNINSDNFLIYNDITTYGLKNYERIMIKYRNLIDKVSEIKPDMDNNSFENLKMDLEINYSSIKSNLNAIYVEIIKSNFDIAEPLLNKLKKHVANEFYEPILKTNMVYKTINDVNKRNELQNEIEFSNESLKSIIKNYKKRHFNRARNKIDIDLSNDNKKEDYNIDIPRFIEDNYNCHKRNDNISGSTNEDRKLYNKRIQDYLNKFARLKRQLERKNTLSKEEVILYNKLESELDLFLSSKDSIISPIKFNYYYNKLYKGIKLSRESKYQDLLNNNKKRM